TKIKTDKEALKKLLAEKQRSAKKIRSMIAELVRKEVRQKQKPVEKKTPAKTNLTSKSDKKTTPTVTPKSKVKDDDYVPPPKIIGSIGKIIWPISSRKILRHYGENRNSETNTIFDNPGIDIAASPGTGVVAAANGTVSLINWLPGYGQLVIINHGNGFRSVYANLSSVSVRKGDEVRQGKSVGRTGHSVDGDFLHFELWTGTSRMNPASYLH
ncbi:MAG: M23 family metallopeptidase, partial [Bacteroidota bacterium]